MQMNFTGERFVPELRGQMYYEHMHRYAIAAEFAYGSDVLDIACGEGYGSARLAATARSVVGVDIDEASIRHASARYTAANLVFRAGSASAIPLESESIDLVVSFETLEHLVEHDEMMTEIRRVLRPAGKLVISSPNKRVYSDARGVVNPYHLRELYLDEFRALLDRYFPVTRIFGQRIFAASAMHVLNGVAESTRWFDTATQSSAAIPTLPEPEYFLAVSCKMADAEIADLTSVFLDASDDLLRDIFSGGEAPAENGAVSTNGVAGTNGAASSNGVASTNGVAHDEHGLTEDAGASHPDTERVLDELREQLASNTADLQAAEERARLLEIDLSAERAAVQATATSLVSARREADQFRRKTLALTENLTWTMAELDRRNEVRSKLARIVKSTQLRMDWAMSEAARMKHQRDLVAEAYAIRESELESATIQLNAMRDAEIQRYEAAIASMEQSRFFRLLKRLTRRLRPLIRKPSA
jgi:ubiquinone/menaquinone biosynthesis C-methylase UbiE